MKPNEQPANKVRGFLLQIDDKFVFRVYSEDREQFKDYKICHRDLEVEIIDNYSSFYNEKSVGYDGRLDYPSRLFEKRCNNE